MKRITGRKFLLAAPLIAGAMGIGSASAAVPAKDLAAETSPTECSKMIKAEVSAILDQLAKYKYDPEVYKKRVRERQGWSDLEEEDEEDSTGD